MVWPRNFKLAVMVGYDNMMTPIVFDVTRSEFKGEGGNTCFINTFNLDACCCGFDQKSL